MAAKYGPRNGGVPPAMLVLEIHTSSPRPAARMCSSTARFTRWVPITLMSYISANWLGVNASLGP